MIKMRDWSKAVAVPKDERDKCLLESLARVKHLTGTFTVSGDMLIVVFEIGEETIAFDAKLLRYGTGNMLGAVAPNFEDVDLHGNPIE